MKTSKKNKEEKKETKNVSLFSKRNFKRVVNSYDEFGKKNP
jgi:hypothetical protein